jgi:hypothetical protein
VPAWTGEQGASFAEVHVLFAFGRRLRVYTPVATAPTHSQPDVLSGYPNPRVAWNRLESPSEIHEDLAHCHTGFSNGAPKKMEL